MKKSLRRIGALAVAAVLLISSAFFSVLADTADSSSAAAKSDSAEVWKLLAYDEWLEANKALGLGKQTVRVEAAEWLLEEGKELNFSINAPDAGLYTLKIGYTAVAGESLFSSPIELSVAVNDVIPYREAATLTLSRIYESVEKDFAKDDNGNDIQPEQKEVTPSRTYLLSDGAGYNLGGLYLPFNAGDNKVTLKALRSGIKVSFIEIAPADEILSYKDYISANSKNSKENKNAEIISIEAENIHQKSDCTIVPASDRSSSSVTPNTANAMLLNTVGSSFSKVGQWVSWKIKVEKAGFYKISLYAKQAVNSGAVSGRKLLINGEVPFKEAENFSFPFSQGYENYVLSASGDELLFYFEAGEHEISLEAVLGDMNAYLSKVSSALTELNDDYLRILFYTGSSPDIYREYGFEKLIPEVLEDFSAKSKELFEVSDGIKKLSAGRGSSTATLDKLASLLEKMADDTDEIAKNFSQFKDSLSALGSWLNEYTAQPLQIDSLSLIPEDGETKGKKEGFFSNFFFKFKIFMASFANDYVAEEKNVQTVSVWVATGRDQSKIIDRLAKNDASKTGINAKVSLVSGDALLPNVLAGSDIDVFLNATAADPINYAIRGAVLDLSQFEDFDEVASRFHSAALVPFTYKDAVYALPESLDFPLLFYRKDIFENLELSVPKTWDDFYETVAVLQKNNLTVGVTWTDMFNLMLYQSGGSYYNDTYDASALDEFIAVDAFAKTLRLYTDYALPVEFSFANRFRSGDMPMGIVPYTMYNQLYLFAPEIDGLWEFTAVPGTVTEDGSINNGVIAGGTGAVMLRTTKDKNAAWEFLKWWTETNTQINFGIEMEKVMGAAARQSSANIDVVGGFPWSADEFNVISTQWKNLNAIPQIPGSYYMTRTLEFAFNSVYSLGEDASRALLDNVVELNEEITRKIAEFERS